MRYFCRLCRVPIKNKSSQGWMDHVRGAKHQQLKAPLLSASVPSLLASLRDQALLTPEEYSLISQRYSARLTPAELQALITQVMLGE